MESRGQKRPEIDDELPADKRACSSLEFKPSTSSSSQTPMNSGSSTPENNDQHDDDHMNQNNDQNNNQQDDDHMNQNNDQQDDDHMNQNNNQQDDDQMDQNNDQHDDHMDTESEGGDPEPERDDSCEDSEEDPRHNDLRDCQRRRADGDHGKFQTILASLGGETDPSNQLVMLTELCEVLSFCTEDSLSGDTSDSLSPILVKLARDETSADIMLLAIRAMTYLCDVYPNSSPYLVRHNAVPALCERLLAIEYLDVAEQCLQALEKLSREQPLACLQAGAIMAVLSYIDFFSTSIQRVAISTVANICKKLPSEGPSPFMEAVPTLCNLLQYEDPQLVENVAICLIRITERVSQSSEMLDDLCKHGVIRQATHFMSLNSRTTLSQPTFNGLIGVLVKLSSGSVVAFRTLYELNISSILKDILSTYDLSHGISSTHVVDGHCYQVYEVLKLLNELLPTSVREQDAPQFSDKESLLVNQPDLLQKFAGDILPSLIQVVNSGANLYICYGCLSVLNKLIYLSTSDMLVELLKDANISSFLAGVFTRKDPHVVILTLRTVELLQQKFSDFFMDSFIKEGVFFAIDSLLTPEKCSPVTLNKCSKLVFPVSSGTRLLSDSTLKSAPKEVLRCLCYAFPSSSSLVSEKGCCMLEVDSVYNLANHVRTKYFAPGLCDPEKALTDVLQKLRTFATSLSDLTNMSMNTCVPDQHEERFYGIMHQVMEKLCGREPISTFEFIESGILKSLMTYLSNDLYLKPKGELVAAKNDIYTVEERFELFARLLLCSPDPFSGELPILTLIRRLQSSLSTLENFPVILSHIHRQRNSFATVPYEQCTTYVCMRAQFIRDKEETSLGDYSEDVLTVDPFASLDAIEGYLWPKVNGKISSDIKSAVGDEDQSEHAPFNASSSQGGCPNTCELESMSTDLPELKEDVKQPKLEPLPEPVAEQPPMLGQTDRGTSLDEIHAETVEKEMEAPQEEDTEMEEQCPLSFTDEDASPKLIFFLEGKQLERSLTLYQAILQQQLNEDEMVVGSKLWSKVYTLTYRRAVGQKGTDKECLDSTEPSVVSEAGPCRLHTSFFSGLFPCELASDLEKSSPIYDILYLLKSLESMNKYIVHLMSHQKICAFAEGKISDLKNFQIAVHPVPQNEFLSSKLTEKLEQQMRDGLAMSVGGMPLWCNQLMASCPFLFSFDVKCKYFRLAAFGPLLGQPLLPSHNDSGATSDRRLSSGGLPRQKFLVFRNRLLESAAQMMDLYASQKVLLEVEYEEEVGTGLGPTLEFYTLVSHEFQKSGLGMWREDGRSVASDISHVENIGILICPCGLFPRPWSSSMDVSDGTEFKEVINKFVLLGKIVGKALLDGRVMDLHFSKAFYKLILGQELGLYDIQSFDPVLGRTLLEFKAITERKKFLESVHGESTTFEFDACFQQSRIEDLCLDFTVPGYPDFVLPQELEHKMVNSTNLEDYVALLVDATINAGISRQVEAFKSGFNQVFPIEHLHIFAEEEIERLLCGECDSWAFNELLDHVKFDHGYTASSPPIVNMLEIVHEFTQEQRRAFLQFVTGAPRLPPGGFASLNPKLTIVRKHSSNSADLDLPSVMTCANYLKLPPYSSKEKMKEKLLYAIEEGQGSFHLS